MAITAPVKLSDFSGFLNPTLAQPIFEKAARVSVVQQLVQQVPLGGNGVSVPIVTGDPVATWVDEAATKTASNMTMGLTTMSPKKLAVLFAVSAEVVRADPAGFMNTLRTKVGSAFALAFDSAVLHGTNTPFAAYIDQTTKAVELGSHTAAEGGTYQDLVSALRLLVDDGRELNGFALDNVMEPTLIGSVDTAGRPIFVDTPPVDTFIGAARRGQLIGRPAFMGKGVATTNLDTVVGYAGDWTQAAWGVVGGISYDVSTEATMTINGSLVSLWEKNLVGIRAEAEYGFVVNNVANFVRLSNLVGS